MTGSVSLRKQKTVFSPCEGVQWHTMTILMSSLQHITPLKPPPPPPQSSVPSPTGIPLYFSLFSSYSFPLYQSSFSFISLSSHSSLFFSFIPTFIQFPKLVYWPMQCILLLILELIHTIFVYQYRLVISLDWYSNAHMRHVSTNIDYSLISGKLDTCR
jgi:hypothetical protein